MWRVFNLVMRLVSTLLGLIMMGLGVVWILQGSNLAFKVGFMAGDWHWAIYGAIMFVFGVAQALWSNSRQDPGDRRR